VITLLANPWLTGFATAAVLALEVWFLNGAHLPHPPHVPSVLSSALAVGLLTALVLIVGTTETERLTNRRTSRTTTNGDTHS
jgi:hypothetical protein